ncbi:MAG: hypothetical protein Q4C91_04975 [Eubacteriales bacterium]|nr:hypothetical protein [Eubacteriales bacterium]
MKFRFSKRTILGCALGMTILVTPVSAATHEFNFKFTDVYTTKDYDEVWAKSDNENSWYITLLKSAGLLKNSNMSSTNIFGCRMRDMSVEPTVDVYHTFSNYISNYKINYLNDSNGNQIAKMGHAMRLRAKKDDSSTSSSALTVYGKCAP